MKLLFLHYKPSPLVAYLKSRGHVVVEERGRIDLAFIKAGRFDWAISYGYHYILKPPIIHAMPDRILNLHASLLPWNRGAYPNLWSFLEDTPKGVTIHYMDEQTDTGDIMVQKPVVFDNLSKHTLATTYDILDQEIQALFYETWPAVEMGRCVRTRQSAGGTFHTEKQSSPFLAILPQGWDTPVAYVMNIKHGKSI